MIDSTKVNKPMQFKIETPIGSIESDSGNHLVDMGSVCLILIVGIVLFKRFGKGWLRKNDTF